MTERTFRIILGAILLAALYFEWPTVIYGFIALMLFEGITNWRVPLLVSRLTGNAARTSAECSLPPGDKARINFEAERALRLAVATFLLLSHAMFNKELWFFPWFIGFALFGAGLSGICPMVMGFRWLGFR